MKKKVIYRLSFVLSLLIIVLLVWNGCSKRAELSALREQLSKFNIGEQAYIEQVNEQGNKIAEQEQIILSQKDAIQNNLLVIKRRSKSSKN